MFVALLGIVMFRAVPVTLPASYGTPLPDHAAIGANGSVAVALTSAGGASRIGILRPNGTTTYLSLPATSGIRTPSDPIATPRFGSIVLASDGTPFVSVDSCFEAVGGGGCTETLFVWTGVWHPLPHPPSSDNFTIAGAETFGSYVLVDNYGNRDAMDSHNLGPVQAHLYRAGTLTELGSFDATSMRGNYVSASESTETNVMDPPTPPPVVRHAIAFDGTTRVTLGTGTASAVNAHGDVVGTDDAGRPALWSNGTESELSQSKGSADAINDAGAIVGTANSHLFYTDAHDPKHRIYALDDLLTDHTLHVSSVLGIAGDGRILALVRRGTKEWQPGQLMLLDPVRASP